MPAIATRRRTCDVALMLERTRLVAHGDFVVAEVTPTAAPLPARYHAPIDIRRCCAVPRGYDPDAPPVSWFVQRICEGDAEMQARFLEGCARLTVADEDLVADSLSRLLYRLTSTAVGASFARRALSEGGPLRASLRVRLLGSHWLADVFRDADAPVTAERVEQSALEMPEGERYSYLLEGDGDRLLYDAPTLVATRAPEAALALLHHRPDAFVEVIVALQSYIEQARHARLWDRLCSLDVLARIHKDSAREVVERTDDLAPLLRFFVPGALADYAERHHLPIVDDGAALAERVVLDTAIDVQRVNRKPECFPCGGDGVLEELAALTPALRGAAFEEVPHLPSRDDDEFDEVDDVDEVPQAEAAADDQLEERYRWRAWWRGERFDVIGGDFSSWLDVARLVGLLNAMLVRSTEPRRFHMVVDDGYTARVLLADPADVTAAVDDGVLSVLVDTVGTKDE